MEDFEKQRTEYVQRLETQLQLMQRELAIYKPQAEKWSPVIESKLHSNDICEITLKFGNKIKTVNLPSITLMQNDVTGLVTSCAEVFAESIISERIREMIEPHIIKLKNGALSVNNTNKW